MAEQRSGSGDWLRRAKSVMPSPVKRVLKPIVAPLRLVSDPTRPWAVADRRTTNSWTIHTGSRTHKFFFITGCYKSGTNWVMNVLNLHPDVVAKGEFHFEVLYKGVDPLTQVPWYLSSRSPAREVAIESAHDTVRRMMYATTRDKPEATWIGDRTPRGLAEILPGAPTINIRRDGRDVMVSWNFHHLRVPDTSRFLNQFRPLGERICPEFRVDPASFEKPGVGFLADEGWFRHHARVWAQTVRDEMTEAARFAERQTPLLRISYEAMHADLEGHRRKLYEFLGLDASLAQPPSRESRTLVGFENASPTQFYRKGATGEWRDYFDDNARRWFKEEAGDVLVAAGYEEGHEW